MNKISGITLIVVAIISAVVVNRADLTLPDVDDTVTVNLAKPVLFTAAEQRLINKNHPLPAEVSVLKKNNRKEVICQKNIGCILVLRDRKKLYVIPQSKRTLTIAERLYNNPPS